MKEINFNTIIPVIGVILSAIISAYGAIKAAKIISKPNSIEVPNKFWKFLSVMLIWILLLCVIIFFIIKSGGCLPPCELPLTTIYTFDFEKKVDEHKYVGPWKILPAAKKHTLLISSENAHSGKSSLRLAVNMGPIEQDPNLEYGGLSISKEDFPFLDTQKLTACSAWLMIPESEQTRNLKISAHLIIYIGDKNGRRMINSGEETRLTPGKWIPLFSGITPDIQFPDISEQCREYKHFKSDNKLYEFYLTVWTYNKGYEGSIYIDDIVFYSGTNK